MVSKKLEFKYYLNFIHEKYFGSSQKDVCRIILKGGKKLKMIKLVQQQLLSFK